MASQTSINKVLGAIALSGISGALTKISANIIRPGDVGLVATPTTFYIYKAQESNAKITVEPYSSSNPPWILKPEDSEEYGSIIRWHLVSSSYFNNDVVIELGKVLKTTTITGNPDIEIYTGSGIKVAKVTDSGFWVKALETDSTKLVKNLNAEFIKGLHGDLLMTKDGTRAFIAPVSGCEPIEADHLSTKNYVDEKINLINPDGFMRRDGSTSFTNSVVGIDPTKPEHMSTKNYVDEKIADTLEQIDTMQNYIIYKTGTKAIPVRTSKMTITFGGILKSYTVFTTIVNSKTSTPFSITTTVINQTNTSFGIDFGRSCWWNWLLFKLNDCRNAFRIRTLRLTISYYKI